MAVALTDIVTKVRYIVGDYSRTDSDIFTYVSSNVFTLTESNVIAVSEVGINDITSGISYTYDSDLNQVTVVGASVDDTIEVFYSYYSNYSDTEIQAFIRSALIELSIYQYKQFEIISSNVYPEPEYNEENLIAMIAGILINPDNKTLKTPDLSIVQPYASLPTKERIERTITVFKKSRDVGRFEII